MGEVEAKEFQHLNKQQLINQCVAYANANHELIQEVMAWRNGHTPRVRALVKCG